MTVMTLKPATAGVAGVAGVREDRGDHLVALAELAAGREVGAHDAGVGVDGVRAAAGLQGDGLSMPRDRLQVLAAVVDDLQQALQGGLVLQRVQRRRACGSAPAPRGSWGCTSSCRCPRRCRSRGPCRASSARAAGSGAGPGAARSRAGRAPPRGACAAGTYFSGLADRGRDLFLGPRHQHAALAGHALLHDQGLVPARRAGSRAGRRRRGAGGPAARAWPGRRRSWCALMTAPP